MGKFIVGNGQYVVYANTAQEARQVISQELRRVDSIKEKIANLLSQDGEALKNFLENSSEENLNIYFNDETSLIYDNPENTVTKGEVRQRSLLDGKFTYDLAYRYPDMQGHNADFRLAHEMGHLILNPANASRQVYDRQTNSRQVAGLLRMQNGQFYGMEMQENAINLIAQLAIRGEHSADSIMAGQVDLSEFNSYKKCDDLVRLLAVSMRNDFDNEISFEQLAEQKIDSVIEHSDGTREPANTFFYGILNDSSIIEKDFDKYMGQGAWRDLNVAITELHQPNISKARFDTIFKTAQDLILEFSNIRMQDKYRETVSRQGDNVPSLDNKVEIINQIAGIEERQTEVQLPEGYQINEFGEIIRPNKEPKEVTNSSGPSFRQRIAQMLQNNNLLKIIPFIEKFINKQLNVLPPPLQESVGARNEARENFVNMISNNGEYRNLPPIQRMSNQEKIEQMRRKMQQQSHEELGE